MSVAAQTPSEERQAAGGAWLILLGPAGFAVSAVARVCYLALVHPDRLLGFVPDDAFYYFGVAEHLRAGLWFSFDGLTRTNGFHPLWAFLITPVLWWSGHDFAPVLLLGAVLAALAILVLARTVERLWDRRTAVAFGWLMALNPAVFTHAISGLETGLLLCTASLLLWLVFARNVRSVRESIYLGVLTAAVGLSRTDAALLAGLTWLVVLADHRDHPRAGLRVLTRAGAVALVLMAPWFIFNATVFGGFVQDSGWALASMERRYHEFHGSLDVLASRKYLVLLGGLRQLCSSLGLGHLVVLAAVCAAGTLAAWRRGLNGARLGLLAVLAAYGTGILISGAWRLVIREWYLAPVIALPMLLGALALSTLRSRALVFASALGLGAMLAFNGRESLVRGPWPDQASEPAIIRVLNRRFAPGELVGASDAGMLGWYGRFTAVNLDGLANSDVLPAIERGQMLEYLRQRGIHTFFFGRDWWKRSWLMGPGSGLLYADEVVSEAGKRPDGSDVTMSRVLDSNGQVAARFWRQTIASGDADFGRWLGVGWSVPGTPSRDEIWSSGLVSDVYLPLDNTRAWRVTLWLNAIGSPERRSRVRVAVNGQPAGTLVVTNDTAHQPYPIDIPRPGPLVTQVRLQYDRTWNPRHMGLSSDSRELAVSIVRIDTAHLDVTRGGGGR